MTGEKVSSFPLGPVTFYKNSSRVLVPQNKIFTPPLSKNTDINKTPQFLQNHTFEAVRSQIEEPGKS